MLRARLRRLIADDRAGQSGYTLVELIVAAGVFFIFVAILMTSIVSFTKGITRTEVTAEATNEGFVMFQTMDRQIRYADAINFPGNGSSGARYIEFRTQGATSISGVTTCTQWKWDKVKQILQVRSWPDLAGSTATPWATKLRNVIDSTATGYPFAMTPASMTGSTMQQLVLTVNAGNPDTGANTALSTTFVARNSSITSPSNSDSNSDGASDSPVCLSTGTRP
jgi:type II secretory pathway pseudopilin PulG